MKAELVPEDGGPPIPITRDLTVVGRREYCDVRLDHPSLSKRHAILVKTDGLLILRDLVSTNGTKVKGQRIRWAALLPDDRIAFGSVKFRVYLGPDNVPAPSEVPRPAKRGAVGRTDRAPVAFAAPSPLGTPAVALAAGASATADGGPDSEDWRHAMKPLPVAAQPPAPLNEHELIIEADDAIVELDDNDRIPLA